MQDLGDGAGVAGEPEDVLEEDGVDVDEDGAAPAVLLARHRLEEQPERVGVEHEAVHRERPPLLPDHDRHRGRRRRRGPRVVVVVGRGAEGAVADAGRRGRRPPEEDAAAGHGDGGSGRRVPRSASWRPFSAAPRDRFRVLWVGGAKAEKGLEGANSFI